jgi:hypothetical protein
MTIRQHVRHLVVRARGANRDAIRYTRETGFESGAFMRGMKAGFMGAARQLKRGGYR